MRTTIELTDDQRAKLLALAAKRRLRGYSALIQEALERYLKEAPNGGQTGSGAKAARVARIFFATREGETGVRATPCLVRSLIPQHAAQ
jgi:hypothetical protein